MAKNYLTDILYPTSSFSIRLGDGLRLPTLAEYAGYIPSPSIKIDNIKINQYGMVSGEDEDLLIAVETAENKFRLMPGPEFSPRLYRGQTNFYEDCLPSIFRGTSTIDRFFSIGKWIELAFLLEEHPAKRDLGASRIQGLSFDLRAEGIAQHYGFKTRLMDFSRSKDVAMFFATCRYDVSTETYNPMDSAEAVLYTVNLKKMIKNRNGDSEFLPLGLEPLPRPAAQKALAIRLNPGENLNYMPWISDPSSR